MGYVANGDGCGVRIQSRGVRTLRIKQNLENKELKDKFMNYKRVPMGCRRRGRVKY